MHPFDFCPMIVSESKNLCPSIHSSECHINFNLAHIFCSINDRALIYGLHDPCDKPFHLALCCDLVI